MTQTELMNKYCAGRDTICRWLEELGLSRGRGNHKRPVAQYDPKTGDVIAIWNSASEAGRAMYGKSKQSNIVGIGRCCLKQKGTACGYVWRFWTGPIIEPEVLQKRRTSRRLAEFREKYGLGSDVRIAEASGGALTPERVREMRGGLPHDERCWNALAEALDRIESGDDP